MDQKDKKEKKRAQIYLALARLLQPPQKEIWHDLRSGQMDKMLQEALGEESIPVPFPIDKVPGTFDELLAAYNTMFVHQATRVHPIESVYRKWSEDDTCTLSFASNRGYLMSNRAMHMLYLYREAGLEVPEQFKMAPDHLTLLLEFMAFLCMNTTPDQQNQFIDDHLDWLDLFLQDCEENGHMGFYANLIHFISGYVEKDKKHLLTIQCLYS